MHSRWIGALLALTLAGPVVAADEENQWYLAPMLSYVDGDKDRLVDDEFIPAGRFAIGRVLNPRWNVEFALNNTNFEGFLPQDELGLGIDFMRVFNRDGRFSPYLLGGAGFLRTEPQGLRRASGASYSAAVGALWNFTDRAAIRGEYRLRNETAFDHSDQFVGIGLQLMLGEKRAPDPDSDGDGIPDSRDRCPSTPVGTRVDEYGCELDSDGDGVVDSKDRCPNTPAGVSVDVNGCAQDSDGDGVSDDRDQCPNTVAGAVVDANGCELDGDGDGIVDRLDRCLQTPAGARVDLRGCEIKDEIRLPGVNFETNSDRLLPGAEQVLRDAATTLARNPDLVVEVAGHTDDRGAADYNQGLSERRAKTVHDYLVNNGADAANLSVRGYGEVSPIATNDTAAGRAENRRVVLRLLN